MQHVTACAGIPCLLITTALLSTDRPPHQMPPRHFCCCFPGRGPRHTHYTAPHQPPPQDMHCPASHQPPVLADQMGHSSTSSALSMAGETSALGITMMVPASAFVSALNLRRAWRGRPWPWGNQDGAGLRIHLGLEPSHGEEAHGMEANSCPHECAWGRSNGMDQ